MNALRKRKTERWFRFAIGFGAFTALALLGNSVANYALVSQKLLVDHVRKDLAAKTSVLDSQLRSAETGASAVARVVHAMHERNAETLAWIQLRDAEDRLIAHAGDPARAVFPASDFRRYLQKRQSAFRLMESARGEVVVEAFPIRLRPGTQVMRPTAFRTIANSSEERTPRGMAVVEIAAYVNAVDTVFWPIRRSLFISVTAALALLAALGVMAFRFRAYLKGQRLEEQVAQAGEVQRDLVGATPSVPGDFELACEYSPASGIGGDFHDAFSLKNGCTAFVLGDVAGKGVPAALLMGVIHGAVRSSAWSGSAKEHAAATAMINRLLCEKAARSRYASMFWAYFDPANGMLHYVNAGHFAPLLFRAGAHVPERLEVGGPVLGLLTEASYRQGSVRLEAGDTLVMYSDGIVEAANPLGEFFGEQRLTEAVLEGGGTEAIRERVLGDVRRFSRSDDDADDRTLVVIRYAPKAAALLAA